MNYYIKHSAKGSSWKKHKYIKKVGNKYFYPNSKGDPNTPDDNDPTTTDEYRLVRDEQFSIGKDGKMVENKNYKNSYHLEEFHTKTVNGKGWLDSRSTSKVNGKNYVTIEKGKISQTIDKGKNFVSNLFKKKK